MKKKPFEDPLKGLNITYRRGKDLEEWSRFESTFKAYNITVLINAMFEFGITPDFLTSNDSRKELQMNATIYKLKRVD